MRKLTEKDHAKKSFINIIYAYFRADLLKLCQLWDCLPVAVAALGSFDYLNEEVVRDCVIAYLLGGNVDFVDTLVKYNVNSFNYLKKTHFRELYSADKIMLRVIKALCEQERSSLAGLQVGSMFQR